MRLCTAYFKFFDGMQNLIQNVAGCNCHHFRKNKEIIAVENTEVLLGHPPAGWRTHNKTMTQ